MRTPAIFAYLSLITVLSACTKDEPPAPMVASGGSVQGQGGSTNGGSSNAAGGSSSSSTSSSSSSNGGSAQGGSNPAGGSQAVGGSSTAAGGTTTANGGATNSAGGNSSSVGGSSTSSPNNGGTSTTAGGATNPSGGKSAGGTTTAGGTSNAGGAGGSGGAAGSTSVTASGAGGAAVTYKLPPPDQCHDQDFIPGDSYAKTGCVNGDASSQCGGKCQVINACSETTQQKPNADVTFMCQRNLLFSPEMEQAAADDGMVGFHYAVVGHDVDRNGIDGTDESPCCQCYQLVYAYPSPNNDRQVQLNPDNPNPPASAVPIPPPLIVQAFNTAATPTTFDVYMPAGGLGANNACFPIPNKTKSASGLYMYTGYPEVGQPSEGGVKPVTWPECRTKDKNWVTTASFSDAACTKRIQDTCNQITSTIPGLTDQARRACIQANSLDSLYHLNWSVYAMKVNCPENLTRVTGCKLARQSNLKDVKPNVKTAAQAALDKDFWAKTSSSNNLYETTTMEDCCRPSCAAINWISGRGLTPDPKYRAFYTCDVKGVPYTQPQ